MNPLTNQEKEELRHAVLEMLTTRHPAALPPAAIRRHVQRQVAFAFDDDELNSALAYLGGLGYARNVNDSLGSSQYWIATTAGVQFVERSPSP